MRLISQWRALWQHRLFLKLCFSQLGSLAGDSIYNIAIITHVYYLTGSALQVGTLLMFTVLPSLLVGSIAGVFVDRWPLKRVLVVADLLRAGCVLGVLWSGSLAQIYAWSFLLFAAGKFFYPAYTSVVTAIVPSEHLAAANSFNTTARRAVQLVVPAAGALLIAALGHAAALVINAASFVVSALVLFTAALPAGGRPGDASRRDSPWREWLVGYHWVRTNRLVRTLVVIALLLGLPIGVNNALIVVFTEQVLRLEVTHFGLLISALALGVMLGGILSGQFLTARSLRLPLAVAGLVVTGAAFLLFAFNRAIWPAILLRVIIGIGITMFNIATFTSLQEEAPPNLRGRVFTFYFMVDETSTLLFLGLAGLLADIIGVALMFALAGSAVLAAALYGRLALPFVSFSGPGAAKGSDL